MGNFGHINHEVHTPQKRTKTGTCYRHLWKRRKKNIDPKYLLDSSSSFIFRAGIQVLLTNVDQKKKRKIPLRLHGLASFSQPWWWYPASTSFRQGTEVNDHHLCLKVPWPAVERSPKCLKFLLWCFQTSEKKLVLKIWNKSSSSK